MKLLALLFAVMLAVPAWANPLRDLFETHYRHHYEPRFCGKNALNFVKAIAQERGSAEGFHVVTLENKGFSVFGMVNAEMARGTRFNKPANEERNWYHHAFVLDDEGNVYDFDFTIEPRIVPLAQYLDEMFLDEEGKGGRFDVDRDTKRKEYVLESTPAQSAIDGQKVKPRKATLGEAYDDFRVLTQKITLGSVSCPSHLALQINPDWLVRLTH